MASLDEMFRESAKAPRSPSDTRSLDEMFRAYASARGIQSPTPSGGIDQEKLGPPGLDDVGLRFGIGEGNTFGEKLKSFQKKFPEGDLVFVPVTSPNPFNPDVRESSKKQILFRETPDQAYRKVDPKITEKFEPLNDIVQFFAGDVGAIGGEILAAISTKGISSIKLLPLMARMFAGAASGETIQQTIQQLRGINEEKPADIAAGSLMKGAASVAGTGVGNVASKLINALPPTNAGFLALERGATDAISASQRLGLPPPLANQLAVNPTLKRVANQSAASTSSLNIYVDEQTQAAVRALDKLKPSGSQGFEGALIAAESKERAGILRGSLASIGRKIEGTTAGRRIQQLVDSWNDTSRANIDVLYNKARSIEEPNFDLNSVLPVAQDIERGVVSRGVDGGAVKVSGTKGDPVQASVLSVIDDLKQLDPNVRSLTTPEGKTISGVDQLNALRKRLYDAKTPDVGEVPRESHAIAQKLYSSITEAIENPVGGSPSFVSAWKQATRAASDRFGTLDKLLIHKAIASEEPAALAARLIKPGQVDNLAVLRKIGGKEKFAAVQDRLKTTLIETPENIVKEMDKFDAPTLNMLMSKQDQAVFREAGSRAEKLNSLGIKKALTKQVSDGAQVRAMLDTSDTRQIAELSRLIENSGGLDGKLGLSTRAGLIDNIITDVTKFDKGGKKIDFKKLNTLLDDFEKRGLTRFLKPSDIQHLKDQRIVSAMIQAGDDVGASMAGASASANVVFRTSQSAIFHMVRLMGLGRALTFPAVTRFLIGTGAEKSPHTVLKVFSAAMGTALVDLEKDEKDQ